MVIGAAWNGARAFTATSGPGISLMQEFIGLAYFAEIPAVIFDVQRGGPSTGMPTRTQQSDILIAAYASHGDTKHVLLFPEDPHECFEFGAAAFDLADRLQTPVFVMLDLDIGMNEWLCEPLAWDDARRFDRGKVLTAEELEAGRDFGRYLDVDGDGIPYRTYPGTHPTKRLVLHPRHLARPLRPLHRGGRRPTSTTCSGCCASSRPRRRSCRRRSASDADAPDPLRRDLFRLDRARDARGAWRRWARDGIDLDMLRVRAFPFADEVIDFILAHDQVFVVEQNRDAQLQTLLVNEGAIDPARLISVLHYDGTPITARFIVDEAIADAGRSLTGGSPQGGGRMTYPDKAQAPPPEAARERARLHPPRLRGRGLDAVRRLRPRFDLGARSSRPASSCRCRRTASPSCPASAARRRRRPTSSARATASTACTAACRRC